MVPCRLATDAPSLTAAVAAGATMTKGRESKQLSLSRSDGRSNRSTRKGDRDPGPNGSDGSSSSQLTTPAEATSRPMQC